MNVTLPNCPPVRCVRLTPRSTSLHLCLASARLYLIRPEKGGVTLKRFSNLVQIALTAQRSAVDAAGERESSTANSVITSAVPQAIATCGIEIRTREPRQTGCRTSGHTGCTGCHLHVSVTNAFSISTSLLSPQLSHDGRKGEWANKQPSACR